MRRKAPITDEEKAAITAALMARPYALAVARESEGAWSYSTVWRVANRVRIELTAGRIAQGYKRLTDERRVAVIEARRANPDGCQEDIARASGVSRATVSRIEHGDCRRRGVLLCEP
jgi:hypothetical protein